MIRNLFFTTYPKIKDVFILLFKFTFLVFLAVIVLWITYPLIPKYFNFVFFLSCNVLIYLFIFDRKLLDIKAFEIKQSLIFYYFGLFTNVYSCSCFCIWPKFK